MTAHIRTSRDANTTSQVAEISRRLSQAAGPQHRLEHMYVRPSPDGVYAVLFVIAPDLTTAEKCVLQLYECARLDEVAGCGLDSCGVRLITPMAEISLRSQMS
ncbi:MAG TPA: hypothetical protein VGI31_08335 [Streptosporangiaceae bacterium]